MASIRHVAFPAVILLASVGFAADPPSDNGKYSYKQQYAPTNPAAGPTDIFVYSNQLGTWKLAKGNGEGSASYTWNGQMNTDKLVYLGFGDITDNTGVGIPVGQKESVWMFKSTDANGANPNNFIFFAFGVDKLNGVPGTKYPFYFSWTDPTVSGNTMKRVLLPNGTTRQ